MNKLLSALLFILVITSSCKDEKEKGDMKDPLNSLTLLSSPVDTGSAEPWLFTDKNGRVYLSWIEKRSGKNWLKYSVLDQENWSTPQVIASGDNWFVNWADYPLLAADGTGNLIAHFLEKSETGKYTYDVKMVSSADEGKSWRIPWTLHDDGKKAEHGFVSIVPYENNFFISWLDGRNAVMDGKEGHEGGHHGQMTLRGALLDKKGNKSGEWELDERVCDCCQTSAAITTTGPVVVYRDRSETEIRDISIVRLVNNKWTAPKTIYEDNWKIDGCPVNGPRAAALGNTLAVAWFTSASDSAKVNIIFSKDGGENFMTPVRIDEGKGIGRVDVEMLDESTAIVSWMEGAAIKATKVYVDGKKDPSITIATSSESRSSGFPQLARSANKIIFAWTDNKDKKIKLASITL